jgi:Family of unknown function (DUF6252)
MKTTKLILLLAITYLCSSCLGGLVNPDAASGGSVSCTIDGKSWSAKEASGLTMFGGVSVTGTAGSGKNTQTLLLSFDEAKAKTGTTIDLSDEPLSIVSNLTSYQTTVNGIDNFYAVSEGSIIITSATKSKVEGTFSFTGEDLSGGNKPIQVTNGKFSVKLLLQL